MPVDANTYCTLDATSLLIYAPGFILEIDKHTGEWRQIVTQYDENKIVPHGGARLSFDVRTNNQWLSLATRPIVLQWEQRTEGAQFVVIIDLRLGSFHVRQWIRLEPDGLGFWRSLDFRYQGNEAATLQAIDLSLPAMALTAADPGKLILPNHGSFHVLDCDTASRYGPTRERVDEDYGKGQRAPGGIETFPDSWNGVVGLYHPSTQAGVLTYISPSPVPVAFACHEFCKGFAISALQRQEMFLQKGDSFSTSSQHVRFFKSPWEKALARYQDHLVSWGYQPRKDVASWLTGATFYETSVVPWGGCRGLTKALPDLRDLGVDALTLLPIWTAAEVTEEMKLTWRLDPSWQGRAIPHRIRDFESLDPMVGSEDDVRRLVAAAHKVGMKVVLDLVFHGISEPSWLIQRRPHWLVRDPNGDPFASHGWEPGYSLDWANAEVQDFLVDFGLRQVKTFDLDGIRLHAPFWKESNWKPTNGRQPCATNLAVLAILEKLRLEIQRVKPDVVILSEAHGPAFVSRCDMLYMDNVVRWLARLGRDEINTNDFHQYLVDLRMCYPEGSRLMFSLETHESASWEPSPLALRGSAISRPLLAVAALAGDAISLYHGQEEGQEKFLRAILKIRKGNEVLRRGRILHEAVRRAERRQLAWVRSLDSASALITANFDSISRHALIEMDPKVLGIPKKVSFTFRRIFPRKTRGERVDAESLRRWYVDLDPYSVAIDLFE